MPRPKAVATETLRTRLSVALPDDIVAQYMEQSDAAGQTLDETIADRLSACRDHTAKTPIYLDDDHRVQLNRIFGVNLKSASELVALAVKGHLVSVAGVEIPVPQMVLERLQSRTFGKPLAELISGVVTEELERYVGLR